MFLFLAALVSSEMQLSYDKNTGTLTVDGNGNLTADPITNMFPDHRNWTKLILNGDFTFIPSGVFSGATDMVEIKINAPIKGFGRYAFSSLQSLEVFYIPNTVETIGSFAFQESTGLKIVKYTKTTYIIQNSAFQDCSSLEEFLLVDDAGAKTPTTGTPEYGDAIFQGCWKLYSVDIHPDLEVLGASAFVDCFSLDGVILPNKVKTIKIFTFSSCKNLTQIDLSSVVDINISAFSECTALSSVKFGAELKHIRQDAFSECIALKTLENLFNNEQYYFYAGAFQNCESLEAFTIPKSMTFLPMFSFSGCTKLTKILFQGSNSRLERQCFAFCGFVTFNVPASITYIEDDAFLGCKSIKEFSVDSGNTVYAVDSKYKFLYHIETSTIMVFPRSSQYEEVEIDSKYKIIGFECFAYSRISKFKFHDEIEAISTSAFSHNTHLVSIDLPPKIDLLPDGTFSYCTNLKTVTCKNAIEAFTYRCFYKCSNLESITLSTNLSNLGGECFAYCEKLKEISLPNLKYFDEYCFSNCKSLKTFIIPSQLNVISEGVFFFCTALESVTLHINVSAINKYAFGYCEKIVSIELPERLRFLGERAFYNTGLRDIRLPYGVTYLNFDVFTNCGSLVNITIAGRIRQFKGSVFSNSTIREIYFEESIGNVSDQAFDSTPQLKMIKYCGALEVPGNFMANHEPKSIPVPIYVAPYYPGQKFGGISVDNTSGYCPPRRTPLPTIPPPSTPPQSADPNADSYRGFPKLPVVLGICGGVLIITIIVVVVLVRYCMKKNGWAKNETLTESLLTQTV